jgi:hypothetical protein
MVRIISFGIAGGLAPQGSRDSIRRRSAPSLISQGCLTERVREEATKGVGGTHRPWSGRISDLQCEADAFLKDWRLEYPPDSLWRRSNVCVDLDPHHADARSCCAIALRAVSQIAQELKPEAAYFFPQGMRQAP